jgi:hypothetical protein
MGVQFGSKAPPPPSGTLPTATVGTNVSKFLLRFLQA